MPNFADHELLSLHEILMSTALQSKEVQAHIGQIEDPELKRMAESCLVQKRSFVQQVEQILK